MLFASDRQAREIGWDHDGDECVAVVGRGIQCANIRDGEELSTDLGVAAAPFGRLPTVRTPGAFSSASWCPRFLDRLPHVR